MPLLNDRRLVGARSYFFVVVTVIFEAEIVSFANRAADEDGNATDDFQFIATNLKVGLLNNVDLQVVVQPYSRSRIRLNSSSNQTLQTEGFGAIVARLKVNLYGNDTFERPGDSALAVMPYISVPTVRDGVGGNFLEGGLIVPFGTFTTTTVSGKSTSSSDNGNS